MGKTITQCSECAYEFEPKNHSVTKQLGSVAGAGIGALLGSKFGVAGGILGMTIGKIAVIPAAILGLFIGLFVDNLFVQCPDCETWQRY